MKKISKFLSIFLVAFAFTFTLAACNNNKPSDVPNTPDNPETPDNPNTPDNPDTPDNPSDPTSDVVKYQVLAKCVNGKPIAGAGITLYDAKNNKEYTEYTAKSGYATFELKKGAYLVEGEDLPGYTVKDEGDIITDGKGENLVSEVIYDAKLITDEEMPSDTIYSQGDVMYDYTFTGYDFSQYDERLNSYKEVTYKLSDLLESNDLVVLNFWYTTCSWCKKEFPMMEEAYAKYKDQGVKIIGINPGEQVNDTLDVVNAFAQQMKLTITSTVGDTKLVSPFQVSGWPTSVFIDRYGLIGLIESGAITSVAKWEAVFKEYLGDSYVPKYNDPNGGSLVMPDVEFPGSDALVDASVAEGLKDKVTFANEDRDGYEYNWPWKVAHFVDINGNHREGIQPSNKGVHSSYSISYFTVKLPANNVLALDAYCSTDDGDILGIFINGKRMAQLSGISDNDIQTQYIYVAGDTDEEITVELFFYKDKSGSLGDDTVVINNIRYFDASELTTPVYVMRQAATDFDKIESIYNSYITPVMGADGYYHVNSANGPLLLAALLDSNTNFSNTSIASYLASNPEYFTDAQGSFYNVIDQYGAYATNSTYSLASDTLPTNGLTPITEELKDALVRLTYNVGEDEDKSTEWLQMCVYVEFYGTNGVDPVGDPIKGLARFNAYNTVEFDSSNADETTNSVEYTFALLPKGYYFKFTPEKSGVYKIYSVVSEPTEVDFEGGSTQYYAGELRDEFAKQMGYVTSKGSVVTGENFVDFRYYEEGKTYYIKPSFWDVDYVGTLNWRIEYIAASDYHYYQASESTFSTTVDADGNMTGTIISRPNVNVQLGEDGYYHPVRNGQIITEEFIYADFGYVTGVFSSNLTYMLEYEVTKSDGTVIKVHSFDFTKDEFENDISEEDIAKYGLTDQTEVVREYIYDTMYKKDSDGNFVKDDDGNYVLKDNYNTDPDFGLCKVDATLQSILQGLMDKYTFYGISGSWMKLCYYRGYLGPVESSSNND